jgi:hypothetical protein
MGWRKQKHDGLCVPPLCSEKLAGPLGCGVVFGAPPCFQFSFTLVVYLIGVVQHNTDTRFDCERDDSINQECHLQ